MDFYPPIVVDGVRTRREHLRLYIYERPKTELEREHNKETKMLGETIRSQRQLDLQSGAYGYVSSRQKRKDFIAYFTEVCESKKKTSKSNYIQKMCGISREAESIGDALRKFAGDNSEMAQQRKDFQNAISAIENGRKITAQLIGAFPDARRAKTLKEISGQSPIFREIQRINRQLSAFGFPDIESFQGAIAVAQMRMELEEKRQRRLEEIRNMKLKPIVPKVSIENITIEIHLHEKVDEASRE